MWLQEQPESEPEADPRAGMGSIGPRADGHPVVSESAEKEVRCFWVIAVPGLQLLSSWYRCMSLHKKW